ncbi:T9SS type A sorting domain-containing protein [Dyadobacter sp. CY326]|uniref:T9SS type A sorting domain-containing protein n=1 Tax=Dyadobacter sp. CY326 TaxID=2907300 RepID=UPI001F1DE0F5|nr:T9SS type A sorting domain-containing protein [Dyadobacter sp. CY326]MCE7068420.1 T9SS type A sorting domain-containing protein [Dyadobacter sp. CY326]
MKFLQKLVYASGLLSLMMAATPDDELQKNQFALATQVNCGGRTWTHDELLGNVGGRPVYTIIHENRIYIRWDGNPDQSRKSQAFDNTAILLHMDNNRFPNDENGNRIVNSCVNSIDPSTMGNNYLGAQQGNMIPCNGKPITDGLRLGTYIGGDNVKTFQYAIIKDGLLRVNFHRETNTYSRDAISMGLIRQTIEGENGSSMNPNMGFTLNYNEVLSCFWNELPKNPDSVVDPEPNCPGGPTLETISNISQTALRFAFTGNGVPNIDWRIKSGGTVVRNGRTGNLGSTNVDISFSTLSAGNYTLEIEGGECASSVSSKSFSVSQPNCANGPTISNVRNVSPTGLTVDFNGSGIPNLTWRIKAGGAVVANGKTGNLTSNSANISFGILAVGAYALEIEGGDCSSSVSTSNFSIIPGTCPGGPTLGDITNITQTGLRFQFDGNGVPNIVWRVKSGGSVIRSGNTGALTSSLVNISFAALPGGTYTLEIEGGDCISSVSSKTFATAQTNCPGGPTISNVKNITSTSLTVDFNGSGVSTLTWRIKQGGTTVANGTTGNLATNSASITFGALAAGAYTLEIEGGNCTSTISTSNFSVSAANCPGGPTLLAITNVTDSGLRFQFDGNGVPNITWRIKSGGTVVRSGKTGALTSALVNITYQAIGAGSYTLEIEGGDCVSTVSTRTFTTSLPNCASGPTVSSVTNVSPTGLTVAFNGSGVSTLTWRIKQGGTTVANGTTGNLSANSASITFGTLAVGAYTLEIEGGDCVSTISSANFNVTPPICVGGPTIATITNVSTTALTLTIVGTNIASVTWRLKKGNNTVASGTTGGLIANSVQITYPEQNLGKNYTLEVEGGDCVSGVSSQDFEIASTDSRLPCAFGPNLKSITDAKSTELVFNFHGENVASIDWKIMKGSNMMRSARVNLQSDRPKITYAALADGDYTLAIEGGSCKSTEQTMAFRVGAPLPIHISRFDGTPVNDGVELSWNVAEEKDGKGFEIIRFDNQMKIGSVIGAMPLSDQRLGEYKFLDATPLFGNNYYQLKMIDEDGSFLTSRIITVRYDAISETVVAPNPVRDVVHVEFVSKTAGKAKVETYSITGVKMNTIQTNIQAGKNNIPLNVTGLGDGHYFLKVSYGDQKMNLRFFKTR